MDVAIAASAAAPPTDWWMFGVTCASVVGSVAVAAVAVCTANRAQAIANRSERARLKFEARLLKDSQRRAEEALEYAYNRALDDALAGLLRAISEYLGTIKAMSLFELARLNALRSDTESGQARRYAMSVIKAEIQIVHVRASDEHRSFIVSVESAFDRIEREAEQDNRKSLLELSHCIRAWRVGSISQEKAIRLVSRLN